MWDFIISLFLCLSFPSLLLCLSSPPLYIWQVIDWFNWKSYIQLIWKSCSALHNIKSYINTTLSNVLCSEGAVRRNLVTASVSDKEVEVMMVKWLHLAGDRDGGRKERQKKCWREKSWNWQLSQFQTLLIYFCIVHLFLYCSYIFVLKPRIC